MVPGEGRAIAWSLLTPAWRQEVCARVNGSSGGWLDGNCGQAFPAICAAPLPPQARITILLYTELR